MVVGWPPFFLLKTSKVSAKNFFTEEQKTAIRNAISSAEKNTSGEIRIHIENNCKGDVLDRSADLFKTMEMHKTALRNGVLIYLAVKDHKFAVLGDKGINEKVPLDFWDQVRDIMQTHFSRSEFTTGLEKGIAMAGEKLKAYFPVSDNDTNELNDEISFDSES
jgi:uncharacterized membrane protein